MSKLLLVDGSALLHRAYHAYPPLKTKTGEVVGAVYGVFSILYSALEAQQPSHVMVAWDLPKPTFRHQMYVGYKAQRPKAELEMVEQIPRVKELIEAMGIVQVEEEGYEADDIIGTLSKKYEIRSTKLETNSKNSNSKESQNKQIDVVILTGDQDTMQLVSEQVKVLTPAKGQNPPVLYGVDEVFNKYGVTPEQILDYKALLGDPSDNIPGVAGIGPMTAAKLLQKYGSLSKIYGALNSKSEIQNPKQILNPKTIEKLINGQESAVLSRELSRIVTDMTLDISLKQMEYTGLKGDVLRAKLEELGFKSLIRRIFKEDTRPKENDSQMGLFT